MSFNSNILFLGSILSVITIFFGFLALLVNEGWKKDNNRKFFYFSFFLVLWQVSNLLMLLSKDNNFALIWTRLTFIVAALMIFLMLRFVISFPENYLSKALNILVNLIFGVWTILIVYFGVSDNLVQSVEINNGTLLANYGTVFIYFVVFIIINLLFIFGISIYNYKKTRPEFRSQLKVMFIGFVISAAIAVFTDLLSPIIFHNDFLSNFGAFGSVFLVSFTAYAIVKHKLFNIKVILAETAVVIVVLAILSQVILSQSKNELFLNIFLLLIVCYGGYLLIKSVQDEIRKKEQLQVMTTQLAQANNHLKELDEMKTEFVSLASHELLTPVSAIEGYLSMMLDEHLAKVEDPTAARYLDRIYKSSRRLARLIADMLNISRIEEGRLLVEKKDVDLSELVKQVIDEIRFKAEERKQKVIFDNPDGWKTYGDGDKIKEVVVNIIGNSIKYSRDPGEIHVIVKKVPTVMVTSTWAKIENDIKGRPLDDQEAINSAVDPHFKEIVGPDQLLISVKDNGIGIPREELPRLFKKFHRVGNYSTQESQGTGLGLYISRALVELHHGRIWADSEGEGKGSTFTFSLPDISEKDNIIGLEKQIPQDKEQLKPLAKPMNSKHEEQI